MEVSIPSPANGGVWGRRIELPSRVLGLFQWVMEVWPKTSQVCGTQAHWCVYHRARWSGKKIDWGRWEALPLHGSQIIYQIWEYTLYIEQVYTQISAKGVDIIKQSNSQWQGLYTIIVDWMQHSITKLWWRSPIPLNIVISSKNCMSINTYTHHTATSTTNTQQYDYSITTNHPYSCDHPMF